MKTLIAIAFGLGLVLVWPAAPAASAPSGFTNKGPFVWGPPGCVRVWMYRSRQTRYAGAPRCRRIYT
jgi:hypothetical protein